MSEREYLEQRAIVETELATRAEDERAAAAHAAMAAEYLHRLATATIGKRGEAIPSA